MKKEIIQLAIAGVCGAGVVLSLAFQSADRKFQNPDSTKSDSVVMVPAEPEPEIAVDSIAILRKAIKAVNKDTRETVSRIKKKTTLLQTAMMRSAVAAIWPDDRIIPPPVVGSPLPLPEPKLDSLPLPETRRGIFRKRK